MISLVLDALNFCRDFGGQCLQNRPSPAVANCRLRKLYCRPASPAEPIPEAKRLIKWSAALRDRWLPIGFGPSTRGLRRAQTRAKWREKRNWLSSVAAGGVVDSPPFRDSNSRPCEVPWRRLETVPGTSGARPVLWPIAGNADYRCRELSPGSARFFQKTLVDISKYYDIFE